MTPTPASPVRGPERRRPRAGAYSGEERRSLADRRTENNRLYVHFRIGATDFLLGIQQVQEVLIVQEMTPVPQAPALVAGLINLRGQIVPAVDLRVALGEPATGQDTTANVVVRADGGAFSIIADEVFDVLEASPTMLAPPPANLVPPLRDLTTEVCKLPGRLLLVMDVDGVLRHLEAAFGARGGL